MVFCFLVRRTAPRQPVCCGGFFSTIQFSNISSDLRYKNNHKANRSIGQSTLTKRSSYFHIRWLRHFPKVKHYPLSGLVGEESTHGNAVHNQSQARCLMGKLPIARHVQRKVPDLYRMRAPTPTGCCRTRRREVMPGSFGCAYLPLWRCLPAMHGAYFIRFSDFPIWEDAAHARGSPFFAMWRRRQDVTHAPKITRRCVPI